MDTETINWGWIVFVAIATGSLAIVIFIYAENFLLKNLKPEKGSSAKTATKIMPPYISLLILVFGFDSIVRELKPEGALGFFSNLATVVLALIIIWTMVKKIRTRVFEQRFSKQKKHNGKPGSDS